jgi:hypothetical protein
MDWVSPGQLIPQPRIWISSYVVVGRDVRSGVYVRTGQVRGLGAAGLCFVLDVGLVP